ncbi:energy transducer TonB [Candidatus Cyanaurora vandensis]|uniref:energy transducer TonB n=1 Tax=Candidatus Cyanaurora vandensis TaxID=2714958 RepID=UPI00257FD946|nr:energy transducer TonB [Candidatus Cyanaurora vandensis]
MTVANPNPSPNDTPFFPPTIWFALGFSLVLHLGFVFFGRLPTPVPIGQEERAEPELVALEKLPVPQKPKVKPPPPPKPKEPPKKVQVQQKKSGSSARRIFQTKTGNKSIASTSNYNAFDGDSVNGQGVGKGSAEGTGVGEEGSPEGTGTAPEPPPPPPPPEPEPLVKAKLLSSPVAAYPDAAREAGQEGRVIVVAYLDKDGNVTRTRVQTSSGFPNLDAAAQAAVMNMKFEPARRGSVTESSKVAVPINFSLT